MTTEAFISTRSVALDRIELPAPHAPSGLDRLFYDSELNLLARSLLLRATSPSNQSAGRTILADSVARLLQAAPSASVNRARLEAFAVAERLLDPIARLTSGLEAPPRPTFSWTALSPDAALELETALDALRDRVEAPHLAALIRLLDALLEAGDELAWAEVEKLAAEQNALAVASAEPIVVFASLFWTEQGTAWPAIYLVEKSGRSETPHLLKVAAYFASLDPGRPAPALCFAKNLIFAPSKADANAFALHNQAALIFEVIDVERRARFERLAQLFGVDSAVAENLGLVFLAGHEFGHKYDPLNLPKWTEELFADVAAVVACDETLAGALAPETMLRVLLVEALLNYGRSPDAVLYFDSTDQIVHRLFELGAISIDGDAISVAPGMDRARWATVVRDFEESFLTMRQGRLPEHFRRGVPLLLPVRARIARLIASEKV